MIDVGILENFFYRYKIVNNLQIEIVCVVVDVLLNLYYREFLCIGGYQDCVWVQREKDLFLGGRYRRKEIFIFLRGVYCVGLVFLVLRNIEGQRLRFRERYNIFECNFNEMLGN